MKITIYEVNQSEDERRSRVVARYLDKAVAQAVASRTEGWYGGRNWLTETTLDISEATTIADGMKDYLRNTPEYQDFLKAKASVDALTERYGDL